MQRASILGTKVMIVAILALTLLGQAVIIPVMAGEVVLTNPEAAYLRAPGIVGCVAIVGCAQAGLLCAWRLLTMVAGDGIFQPAAFRWVNAIIGCCAAATILFAAAFVTLVVADALPPGVMLLLVTGFVAGLALALLLVVIRGLLRQACMLERDLAEVV